ncbi:MAG: type II toxin-antitoxin system VapC family toxin [Burkholderiaceae bacterium]
MYLLDTNVISELRKPKPHGAVLQWISNIKDSELFLSAVTIGEIQSGIETTRDQDPLKANQIEKWLDQLINNFNILPMDTLAFRIWSKLMAKESSTVNEDAMIAAIAISNNLTVVTRNVKDFQRFEVRLINPFI